MGKRASGATRQMIELEGCGPDDPDGLGAASILAAYYNAEHMRTFRQVLWRQLAIGAAVAEWRAKATLRTLIDSQGAPGIHPPRTGFVS